MLNPTKPWIQNRIWFIIPFNIPIVLFLLWGYSNYIQGKTPLIMLILAVLMAIFFEIHIYCKLQESTQEAIRRNE